jgi:hypothetical protein
MVHSGWKLACSLPLVNQSAGKVDKQYFTSVIKL